MAITNDDNKLMLGLLVGVGLGLLAAKFAPALREVGRPLAKAGVKAGIRAYEQAIESIAHMTETAEDLMAEARSELDASGR